MISVSGVRGIFGETLTPDIVTRFSRSFGTFCDGETVVIGRDARKSGVMMRDAVISGLRAMGCRIIDLGIAATPSIQYCVGHYDARGGIAITASHNPIEWNAMKFIDRTGVFLNRSQGERLIRIYEGAESTGELTGTDGLVEESRGFEHHANHILGMIDRDLVAGSDLTVAIDCCDSASSAILRFILNKLGCRAVPIHCGLTGEFPRGPEPTSENIEELSRKVVKSGADVGFATDPDGDRISIVDEKGSPLGEEYSVTLASEIVLQKSKGPVVTNIATTRAVEDIARKYGCTFERSPVGEVNVVEKMKEVGAIIGGEGNGGVINPAMQYARDAPAAMALFLEGLCRFDGTMSELAEELPSYYMVKKKIPCDPSRSDDLLAKVEERFSGERIDAMDGIRIDRESSWIYVRKSGTEPILRVICEAKTQREAVDLADETAEMVEEILCRT
jgi:phosphomannomutase